jgi:hypothetical protein
MRKAYLRLSLRRPLYLTPWQEGTSTFEGFPPGEFPFLQAISGNPLCRSGTSQEREEVSLASDSYAVSR